MAVYRIVKCPKCGKHQRTSSLKTVKCFSCGHSFNVIKHLISENRYKNEINKEVDFK